jgi:hypothetical protein
MIASSMQVSPSIEDALTVTSSRAGITKETLVDPEVR